ncbi:hypothetical protein PybrP1_003005 [[Pythium] brassicae (nom. inval.)]|nr:hypothetical protein PybrP1_003005 [[Pythium] brassicae (nom. inval.)]
MASLADGDEPDGAAASIQEADIAVQRAIAVREAYKATLQTLLEIVASEPSRGGRPEREHVAGARKPSTLNGSKRSTTKSPSAAVPAVVTPPLAADKRHLRVPPGKEMHVLGDWLLLVRAASVNVVEAIQTWRRAEHQGKPQPYVLCQASGNYLLTMCEDLDFLDGSADLVEWLGFRLARNPFVAQGALDDVKRGRIESDGSEPSVSATTTTTTTQSWRARAAPPPALVKPLVSILPEDDAIDGARIGAAQQTLLEEEALYGRQRALRVIRQYLVDASAMGGDERVDTGRDSEAQQHRRATATVHDEIARVAAKSKRLEVRLSLCERERSQVELTLEDLQTQTLWTNLMRELDLTQDHHVWHWRESCFKDAARDYAVLRDELSKRRSVLTDDIDRLKKLVARQRDELSELTIEKEKRRAERAAQKQRDEQQRRAAIRQKTAARTAKLRRKKNAALSIDPHEHQQEADSGDSRREALDEALDKIAHADELALPPSVLEPLDRKRSDAILQKERRRAERARAAADAARELERRREESVQMREADELASALERLARKKARLRELKRQLERNASVPIFVGVQQLGGRKLRVAVYEQRARGYILDGLRVVAYDPTSSSSFALVLSAREYRSLGYGRSAEGVSAFCKWLCLVYEKRQRRFRLVWSGPPCPPPLRVREHNAARCVHREGLRIPTVGSAFGYFLVAAYVRPDAGAKLHFVVSDLRRGRDAACLERVVAASSLIPPSSLELQNDSGGDTFVVWKHHRIPGLQHWGSRDDGGSHSETRAYSGEVRIRDSTVLVHVFDASPTAFALELHPRPMPLLLSSTTPPTPTRIALMKRNVNPYDVRLPASAFGDLVASMDLSDAAEPSVTPAWLHALTKYVRVLRVARFGCQLGRTWFLATVSLVQLKTEFRSYVLLELADLAAKKHTVRISLSEYLRCAHGARAALPLDDAAAECRACGDDELPPVAAPSHSHSEWSPRAEHINTACPACSAVQDARLRSVRALVSAALLEPIPIDYHGHCQRCGAFAAPVVVAMHQSTTAAAAGLVQRLGYHFACFDMSHCDGSDAMVREATERELRQAIDVERIVVVYNADCGTTASAAHDFVSDLHWRLYPERHDAPFDVVFVVDTGALSVEQLGTAAPPHRRDQDVVEALGALAAAAERIASQPPVRDDSSSSSSSESGHDDTDAWSFEAYLVSEALLVEATRVMLQPALPWRTPGVTVGASSWSTACAFLADPSALRAELRGVSASSLLLPAAQEALDAYFGHAQWPREYDAVRPAFHALLCFMLHASHLRELLRARGGVIGSAGQLEAGAQSAKMTVITLERRAAERESLQ